MAVGEGFAIKAPGHRQHSQPLAGQKADCVQQLLPLAGVQMAEIDDGLRGSLGRQAPAAVAVLPEARKHQQIALQGVFALQWPIGMEVFTATELLAGQSLDRSLHGIDRIAAAGQHRQFEQFVQGFAEGLTGLPGGLLRPTQQALHRHAVFGEGAGFINGEHGGTAEAFHRRWPARQHADAGQSQ